MDEEKDLGPRLVTETPAVPGAPVEGEVNLPSFEPGTCECGCGRQVTRGSRFMSGHHMRLPGYHTDRLVPKQFQKGISGHPGGSRRKPVSYAYKHLMHQKFPGDKLGRTYAEILALSVINEAVRGDVAAAKEITDRVEGKVADQVTIEGDEAVVDVYVKLKLLADKLRDRGPESGGGRELPPGPGGAGTEEPRI